MQRWVHSLGHPWPAVCARGRGVASTAAALALALAPQSDTILDVLGSNVTLHVSGKPEIPLGEAWVLCLLLLSFAGTLVLFLISGAVTARYVDAVHSPSMRPLTQTNTPRLILFVSCWCRWIEKRLENRAVHLALLSETQIILQHACLQLLDNCVEKETERTNQVGDEDEDDEAFQKKIIWLMYQIEVQSSALEDLVSDNKEPTGPATASTVVWDAVNFIQRTLVHLLQELKNQVHKASIKPRDRRVLRHMGGRFDTMRKVQECAPR